MGVTVAGMTARSYGYYDPLAQALDAAGERWALLVVRELLAGPARYGELQARLPGVGTAQLAGRLRELHDAGLIERPGTHAGRYALTAAGQALAPAVYALVRFGIPRLRPVPGTTTVFRASWAAIALRALADASGPHRTRHVSQTAIEDEVFTTVADHQGVDTRPGPAPDATVSVGTDTITALELAGRHRGVRDARDGGLLRVVGSAAGLDRWRTVHGLLP
jgi:DNA-binding HxlR family transcriptional regulator